MASSSSPSHLHLFILFFAIAASSLLSTATSSRASPADTAVGGIAAKVYNKVCDATRFAGLGLNMTEFRYCHASLPYADRVRDLIGRMTVEEKVGALGDWTDGAARIGLPAYRWWSEALHGLSSTGPTTKFDDLATPHLHSGVSAVYNATVFANVINSAASFNETLWKSIGQVGYNLQFIDHLFISIYRSYKSI